MNDKEKEFLSWLESKDQYWIPDEEVEEEFPELEFDMIGVTKRLDPETHKTETPKRDYIQAVKLGQVLD